MTHLKEIISVFLLLLKEVKKDVKVATIIVLFVLTGVCLYAAFTLSEQNTKITAFYEQKIEDCQNERIKEIKESILDYKSLINKRDSIKTRNKSKNKDKIKDK